MATPVAHRLPLIHITIHHHLNSSATSRRSYTLRSSRRRVLEIAIPDSVSLDIKVGIMAREEGLSNKPVRHSAVRAIDPGVVRQGISASERCGAVVAAVVEDIPDAFLC